MKARLLLTSILFLLAQIPTTQAQVTVDVAKITCEEFMMQKLAWHLPYHEAHRNYDRSGDHNSEDKCSFDLIVHSSLPSPTIEATLRIIAQTRHYVSCRDRNGLMCKT